MTQPLEYSPAHRSLEVATSVSPLGERTLHLRFLQIQPAVLSITALAIVMLFAGRLFAQLLLLPFILLSVFVRPEVGWTAAAVVTLVLLVGQLDTGIVAWCALRGRPLVLSLSRSRVGWRVGPVARSWRASGSLRLRHDDALLESMFSSWRSVQAIFDGADKAPDRIDSPLPWTRHLRFTEYGWWLRRRRVKMPVLMRGEAIAAARDELGRLLSPADSTSAKPGG